MGTCKLVCERGGGHATMQAELLVRSALVAAQPSRTVMVERQHCMCPPGPAYNTDLVRNMGCCFTLMAGLWLRCDWCIVCLSDLLQYIRNVIKVVFSKACAACNEGEEEVSSPAVY
jgi:hypothetical protein